LFFGVGCKTLNVTEKMAVKSSLPRINLWVGKKNKKLLEDVCGIAMKHGVELDSESARCVWWGLLQVSEADRINTENEAYLKTKGWRK